DARQLGDALRPALALVGDEHRNERREQRPAADQAVEQVRQARRRVEGARLGASAEPRVEQRLLERAEQRREEEGAHEQQRATCDVRLAQLLRGLAPGSAPPEHAGSTGGRTDARRHAVHRDPRPPTADYAGAGGAAPPRAGFSPRRTGRPPFEADRRAASSTRTTASPACPSASGAPPDRTHWTNRAHSAVSGSTSGRAQTCVLPGW